MTTEPTDSAVDAEDHPPDAPDVEPTSGDSYSGPDPEADPKGDASDEDQGT